MVFELWDSSDGHWAWDSRSGFRALGFGFRPSGCGLLSSGFAFPALGFAFLVLGRGVGMGKGRGRRGHTETEAKPRILRFSFGLRGRGDCVAPKLQSGSEFWVLDLGQGKGAGYRPKIGIWCEASPPHTHKRP